MTDNIKFLQFADKLVPYETFVDDVAATVVKMIKIGRDDPEYVSQRKAFAMFGRANVERWRRQGKIQPCKRPGKVEYRTCELRYLQSTQQDYFKE